MTGLKIEGETYLDKDGYYVDPEKRICTNQETAAALLGVTAVTIGRRMKELVPNAWKDEGFTIDGKRTIIRRLADIQLSVQDIASIAISIRHDAFYVVEEGDKDGYEPGHYGSDKKIADTLGVGEKVIERKKGVAKSIPARVDGHKATIFRLEDFQKLENIQQRQNPEVETNSRGYYKDPKTRERWCSVDTYFASLPHEQQAEISDTLVRRRVDEAKLESKTTVGKKGSPSIKIYRVKDLKALDIKRRKKYTGHND